MGGFCVEFVSDTWPAKEGINDNGWKCPRNGVEEYRKKKARVDIAVIRDCIQEQHWDCRL